MFCSCLVSYLGQVDVRHNHHVDGARGVLGVDALGAVVPRIAGIRGRRRGGSIVVAAGAERSDCDATQNLFLSAGSSVLSIVYCPGSLGFPVPAVPASGHHLLAQTPAHKEGQPTISSGPRLASVLTAASDDSRRTVVEKARRAINDMVMGSGNSAIARKGWQKRASRRVWTSGRIVVGGDDGSGGSEE